MAPSNLFINWKEGILPGFNGTTVVWLMVSTSLKNMWIDRQLDHHPRYQGGQEKTSESSDQYCLSGFSLQLLPGFLGLIHVFIQTLQNIWTTLACPSLPSPQRKLPPASPTSSVDWRGQVRKLGIPQNASQQNGKNTCVCISKKYTTCVCALTWVCPKLGHPSIQCFTTIFPLQDNAKHYNTISVYIYICMYKITIHINSI